jgi:hypothetical protein
VLCLAQNGQVDINPNNFDLHKLQLSLYSAGPKIIGTRFHAQEANTNQRFGLLRYFEYRNDFVGNKVFLGVVVADDRSNEGSKNISVVGERPLSIFEQTREGFRKSYGGIQLSAPLVLFVGLGLGPASACRAVISACRASYSVILRCRNLPAIWALCAKPWGVNT